MKPVLVVGDIAEVLTLGGLSGHPRRGREVFTSTVSMKTGGWGFEVSEALKRIGRPTRFMGRVGRNGSKLQTSVQVVFADESVVTYAGASAALKVAPDFRRYSHLHVCSPFLLLSQPLVPLLLKAKRAGLTTSLSVGWDPRERWDLKEAYPLLDLLIAGDGEARALGGSARKLADQVTLVVVRKGAKGAEGATKGKAWKARGEAAGPVFDAVFVDRWLHGDRVQHGLAAACAASAAVRRIQ